jgi:hypothetical protein
MTWVPISTGADPVKGARYRWSAQLRLPYALAPGVRAAISGAFATTRFLRVAQLERVETFPPLASSYGVMTPTWRLEIVFRAV